MMGLEPTNDMETFLAWRWSPYIHTYIPTYTMILHCLVFFLLEFILVINYRSTDAYVFVFVEMSYASPLEWDTISKSFFFSEDRCNIWWKLVTKR
jgi:hypothetical protein